MKLFVFVGLIALAAAVGAQSPVRPIDPVGTFNVTTSTDEGDLVKGTLTVRVESGGYVGEFVSKGMGTVPVTDIATSGTHMLAILNFDDGKAVLDVKLDGNLDVKRDPDGALTGTWYRFGDGLPITIKK